ncbi:MAG: hypothetical protein AW12_02174 [Candidatus Accumulibacter sp. BA-94]|nr:MAG: hypothetical protein AW12_02174 [Candidatus Accumulibacter sp. BA-94]HCZ15767.1 hypothetical protein [Accumulibacter sp.]
MLFRLALAMGRTLQELRAALSYAEFQEWCLYYQIEPWGEDRSDLRAGIVASTVANYAGRTRAEGAEPVRPADFMPYLERPPAGPTAEAPATTPQLTDDELAAWADAVIFGIPPE